MVFTHFIYNLEEVFVELSNNTQTRIIHGG